MTDCARPALSIVVPAYNEAKRLPSTLNAIWQYASSGGASVEVIIVDDGSTDETMDVARRFQPESVRYRVIAAPHRGKASTVRTGVLAAAGEIVLFTDADLSTPIEFSDNLVAAIEHGADVAIGSREGTGARRVGEPGYRHLMGRVFNGIVRTLAVAGIDDTQCGFKAFRSDAAHDLFRRAKLYASDDVITGPKVTGFDVEILFLARRAGWTIVEVPVFWKHVSGSKVRPFRDALGMLWDVLRVRYYAARGMYDRPSRVGDRC